MRAKFKVFLLFLDLAARVRFLRSFPGLAENQRERLLRALFNSRFPILRKGFWGLNTLTRLGLYGQESVYPQIGYRLKEFER
ncbi:MAG: hypothetical protein IT285_05275 [Bdellovibrionales bacterium]|nr:hypothetical protein [Bdellovibrionales bacterium]